MKDALKQALERSIPKEKVPMTMAQVLNKSLAEGYDRHVSDSAIEELYSEIPSDEKSLARVKRSKEYKNRQKSDGAISRE
jgi:hypothetical protein